MATISGIQFIVSEVHQEYSWHLTLPVTSNINLFLTLNCLLDFLTNFCSLVDNEEQLKRILAFHGPVTAAVDAVTWQDYLGGIIQFHCRDHTNHAVRKR